MVSPSSYLAVPAVGNDLTAPFYAVVEVDSEKNQILAPEDLKGQVDPKNFVRLPRPDKAKKIDQITCIALNMIYSPDTVRFNDDSPIGFMAQVLRRKDELLSSVKSG